MLSRGTRRLPSGVKLKMSLTVADLAWTIEVRIIKVKMCGSCKIKLLLLEFYLLTAVNFSNLTAVKVGKVSLSYEGVKFSDVTAVKVGLLRFAQNN